MQYNQMQRLQHVTLVRPVRLAARTQDFHSCNEGSIPSRVTNFTGGSMSVANINARQLGNGAIFVQYQQDGRAKDAAFQSWAEFMS